MAASFGMAAKKQERQPARNDVRGEVGGVEPNVLGQITAGQCWACRYIL